MQRKTFTLQSSEYTLEEIKEEEHFDVDREEKASFPIALIFDKGHVPHPTQPEAKVHLHGVIFLPLDLGEYPKIPAYDASRFDTILRNWATQQYIWDHDANHELNKLAHYPSLNFFYLVPNLKPWNKKCETFFKALFLHWTIDNFLSNAVATGIPLVTKEHFSDLVRFITNILTGLYRFADAIPNFDIPFLNTALKGFFTVYQELKESVAGYEKHHGYLLKEIIEWIQFHKSVALYMGRSWKPTGEGFVLLRKLAGRMVFIELIQLITATYVDDSVRDHVLFSMFTDSADFINNMVYDILNLPRASLNRRYGRNSLILSMKDRRMSFDDALDNQLRVINNEVINFRKIAKALVAEFPASESLYKYVNNTMLYVDGSLRYFMLEPRYGHCEHKIMKLKRHRML
jgi:hypothetical protein